MEVQVLSPAPFLFLVLKYFLQAVLDEWPVFFDAGRKLETRGRRKNAVLLFFPAIRYGGGIGNAEMVIFEKAKRF